MNLKQSTAFTRTFLMVDSADHITGLAGLGSAVTVTIDKAGAGFGAAAGAVSELANGWYKVALTVVDTGTLGCLSFHCVGAGADPTDFNDQVSVSTIMTGIAVSSTLTVSDGIQKNNVGDVLAFTVTENGAPLDISAATGLSLILQTPGKAEKTRTPALAGGGTSGVVQYTTIAGDIDEAGEWFVQVGYTLGGWTGRTKVGSFIVKDNI